MKERKTMKFENLLELIQAVSHSNLTSLEYEEGETKIKMKAGAVVGQGTVPTEIRGISEFDQNISDDKGNLITCPLVGTFYAASSEEAAPFVQVGDTVKKGQILGIVEAMKLMNEIESEYDGVVTKVLVENGTAVEYGQPLFAIL